MRPFGIHIISEFSGCKIDLNDKKLLETIVKAGITKCGFGLRSIVSCQFKPIGITTAAIISQSHVVIHTFPEAHHVSVDIYTCSSIPKQTKKLLEFFKKRFVPETLRTMEIIRGEIFEIKDTDWITSLGTNGVDSRYHIKKSIFSSRSEYQQIDIIENENFGRMLFLDGDLQIAEVGADEYNKAMIAPLVKNANKLERVAILGGGDGGVLRELLKHNPKKVALVEIDKDVVSASKRFLKNICEKAFDNKRVKKVFKDVNKFLESRHNFDAVICDLTFNPIDSERMTDKEKIMFNKRNFFDGLFLKIKKNLKNNGIISIQCCGEYDKTTFSLIKKLLNKHFKDIQFTKVFIPSFGERWIFGYGVR